MRIPFKNRIIRLPTIGRTTLIVGNVIVLVVLCLYNLDLQDPLMREDVGYRTGFVNIAQLPLIFLLAGKNNIIGYLTGISYERLNWLHRWCARCLLLTSTIHMGYFFSAWAPYDYIGVQLKENTLVWRGLAAWAVLVWIVFSSMTPIRGWCYELFVLQHIVSFGVFLGFVVIHTPAEVHIYIWLPVGIFFFDRIVRVLRVLYANISFFHPKQRRNGQSSGLMACRAEFTPLPHKTTRIVIQNPPISWTPGQHVFLSCHSLAPLQNHPFTIASIPEDGKMEFLVKAEAGGTSRFLKYAEKIQALPTTSGEACLKTVAIEGPYGSIRPLRQFDSVLLIAGSTGATFTVPLLRDVLQGWKENANSTPNPSSLFKPRTGAVTRHVRFVWIVKSQRQLGWFGEALSSIQSEFQSLQEQLKHIKLELTVYVTCDESFTEEHNTILSGMTAPILDTTAKKPEESQHGVIRLRNQLPSLDEKEKIDTTREDIMELRTNSLSSNPETSFCGPDNRCCCKRTVDESSPDAIQASCCCGISNARAPITRPISQTSSTSSTTQPKPFIHPSITVFSGRPIQKDIIRKSLEQAFGESAVVVCGPQGLVADVKQDVCSLSDERAVHKGTGAQGIYLHTESFGY
jgi:NAD(P)H-flavin reductase